jgi:hypothetical protein
MMLMLMHADTCHSDDDDGAAKRNVLCCASTRSIATLALRVLVACASCTAYIRVELTACATGTPHTVRVT